MTTAIQTTTGVEYLANLVAIPSLSEQLATTVRQILSLTSPSASPGTVPWISVKQIRRMNRPLTSGDILFNAHATQLYAPLFSLVMS